MRTISEYTRADAAPADAAHNPAIVTAGGLGGVDAPPAVADCSQHLSLQTGVHAVQSLQVATWSQLLSDGLCTQGPARESENDVAYHS